LLHYEAMQRLVVSERRVGLVNRVFTSPGDKKGARRVPLLLVVPEVNAVGASGGYLRKLPARKFGLEGRETDFAKELKSCTVTVDEAACTNLDR
jgi:hypothetical protein